MMNIVTPEFREAVERLLNDLQLSDCIDAEEYRLAQEFHALPLGLDLWSYGFLTPDGECIATGWELEEIIRSKKIPDLIRALVVAANRYPQLAAFIPARPSDAMTCPLCDGTKVWGKEIPSGRLGRCFNCAGLGWVCNAA
ncbi:MAG: hypothetical protein M3362_10105 [Acidobacteriota bacterium]|nr:hypothetical protein [Acidobacteriota bacterium]